MVAQSDSKIEHQPQPPEVVGWQLVLVSSLAQNFLLPTRVEAFVPPANGRTGWTVWCERRPL